MSRRPALADAATTTLDAPARESVEERVAAQVGDWLEAVFDAIIDTPLS